MSKGRGGISTATAVNLTSLMSLEPFLHQHHLSDRNVTPKTSNLTGAGDVVEIPPMDDDLKARSRSYEYGTS